MSAFNFQWLQRVNITLDPNKASNPLQGQATGGPTIWVYNAQASAGNASAATVSASNYFLGAVGYFSVGDLIYVPTNDPGFHLLAVSTITGTTTINTTSVV